MPRDTRIRARLGGFKPRIAGRRLISVRRSGALAHETLEECPVPQTRTAQEPVIDLEEARLVRRAKAGDVGAFERLYRTHVGRVYAICLRLVREESRAEEVTQDVFVRAWQRIGSFEERSAFSSWLYRMATNRSIDAIRSQVRRSARETVTDDTEAWQRPGKSRDPESKLALEAAIASLPTGARTAFVLHDVEGFRHEEIARMTGMAEGTSKAQLHRARKLLRERLV